MARGNSLARYEDPDYWGDRLFPAEFVAKVAAALTGQGSPPIAEADIWALSDEAPGVVVGSALILLPVASWPEIPSGGGEMTNAIIGAMHTEGPLEGEHIAFHVSDGHAAPRVSEGSRVIVRLSDKMAAPGGVFMIAMPGGGVEMRLYRTNPERWESLAEPARETLYPSRAVVIIGRVIRCVTDFPVG